MFHRRLNRLEKKLDDNGKDQRRSKKEPDGSEIKSMELERLLLDGITLIKQRNAFEAVRELAADRFRLEIGSAWLPRTGSKVSHRALTSAMIDSRDFLSVEKRSKNEVCCPAGTHIAFSGGQEIEDHKGQSGLPLTNHTQIHN